jgi:hypothetical protein
MEKRLALKSGARCLSGRVNFSEMQGWRLNSCRKTCYTVGRGRLHREGAREIVRSKGEESG